MEFKSIINKHINNLLRGGSDIRDILMGAIVLFSILTYIYPNFFFPHPFLGVIDTSKGLLFIISILFFVLILIINVCSLIYRKLSININEAQKSKILTEKNPQHILAKNITNIRRISFRFLITKSEYEAYIGIKLINKYKLEVFNSMFGFDHHGATLGIGENGRGGGREINISEFDLGKYINFEFTNQNGRYVTKIAQNSKKQSFEYIGNEYTEGNLYLVSQGEYKYKIDVKDISIERLKL